MRIEHLQYRNNAQDWTLETTQFSNLTLLVGISGVGKTRILDAIWRIKNIANGNPANGIKWDVLFIASNGDEYRWT
ncbi:MAG: AAA family ATPase, partial [Pyrinomonadaceae bacterium]